MQSVSVLKHLFIFFVFHKCIILTYISGLCFSEKDLKKDRGEKIAEERRRKYMLSQGLLKSFKVLQNTD